MRTMYALIIVVDGEILYSEKSTFVKAGGAKRSLGAMIKNNFLLKRWVDAGDRTLLYVIPVDNPDEGWTRIRSRNGAGTLWWGSWYQQKGYDWLGGAIK